LEKDSLAHYKKLLDEHHAKELPLYSHFENSSLLVKGCTSSKETNRFRSLSL
jgi:hypothetical protein